MSGIGRRVVRKVLGKKKKAVRRPATQKGVQFKRDGDMKLGEESRTERAIQDELDASRIAKGSRKPSVTVGKKSEQGGVVAESTSKGAKARAKRKVELEKKKDKTEAEKAELKRMQRKDIEDLRTRNIRISQSSRGRTKEKDNFSVALKAANETGELVSEFDTLTKNQQNRILNSARRKLEEGDPTENNKRMLRKVLSKMTADDTSMNKGGAVKNRTGSHDFRKGGMVISVMDRRRK
jgi:hypothetical protein